MNEQEVRAAALKLVERSPIMMLGTLGEQGEPHIKAVQLADSEGLEVLWISTNTSSEHITQLKRDPRACLYFVHHDTTPWRGFALGGYAEIRTDAESRNRLWQDGCERYYPLGVTDPDYSVIRFVSEWGKYWQFGTKLRFAI
ncbi:pyridoxamine 5'-phosphate oxidase family protein [Candidatus Bipolaricaulota bacterium]